MSEEKIEQPKDLNDAIRILENRISNIDEVKGMDENKFLAVAHHSLGQGLRNSWFLWWSPNHGYDTWPTERPEIVKWFNDIDIYHADDMSGIILTCFHRKLNGKEFHVEKQVGGYKKHWKKCGFKDGIPKPENKE